MDYFVPCFGKAGCSHRFGSRFDSFHNRPKRHHLNPSPKGSGIGFSQEDGTRLFLSGKALRKEEAYVTSLVCCSFSAASVLYSDQYMNFTPLPPPQPPNINWQDCQTQSWFIQPGLLWLSTSLRGSKWKAVVRVTADTCRETCWWIILILTVRTRWLAA